MITEIGNGLIAVKVAPDASNYRFGYEVFGNVIYPKDLFYDTACNIWGAGDEMLPEGEYKILGEVTKDHIGFDVRKLPDMSLTSKQANELLGTNDKIDLYKLLASYGLYFVNPVNKEKIIVPEYGFADNNWALEDLIGKWQSYEDNLIEKLLIIQKK